MNIKLRGALDTRDGYGYITQELGLALLKRGINVSIHPVDIWKSEQFLDKRIRDLIGIDLGHYDFELIIMYPTYDFKNLQENHGILTMYEATGLPTKWRGTLNKFNCVFTPSIFTNEMFKREGVENLYLPLGINKDFYSFKEREYTELFKFLSIGKMEPRKNINILIEAFKEEFGNEAELTIKTRERFAKGIEKGENINIIEKTIPPEELKELYYDHHCFIFPSRGEAFSFPPRNAVSTGMPTIVTGWSALKEIPGTYQIKTTGFSPMPRCGFSYGEEDRLHMADVDKEHLKYLMRNIKENYEAAIRYTKRSKKSINTWDYTAEKLIEHVKGGLCQ